MIGRNSEPWVDDASSFSPTIFSLRFLDETKLGLTMTRSPRAMTSARGFHSGLPDRARSRPREVKSASTAW
jgi:hypothetical protein